jgi:hypothetical protein
MSERAKPTRLAKPAASVLGVWRFRARSACATQRSDTRASAGLRLGALLLAVAGCSTTSLTAGVRPAARPPAWKRSCEEYARAPVEVSYEDGSGGAAVTYRTRGDAPALRARTEEIARFHNSARARPPALHDLYALPHYAYVEPLRDGAKIVLVPKSADPQQLEKLRRNVQQEVTTMRKHGCGTGQEAL